MVSTFFIHSSNWLETGNGAPVNEGWQNPHWPVQSLVSSACGNTASKFGKLRQKRWHLRSIWETVQGTTCDMNWLSQKPTAGDKWPTHWAFGRGKVLPLKWSTELSIFSSSVAAIPLWRMRRSAAAAQIKMILTIIGRVYLQTTKVQDLKLKKQQLRSAKGSNYHWCSLRGSLTQPTQWRRYETQTMHVHQSAGLSSCGI